MPNASYWDIPWQELEVSLGILNTFSLRNLNIRSIEHADAFLKNCGFDVVNPTHERALNQFFGEALFFIRHILFTEEERGQLNVPSELLQLRDFRNLVLFASDIQPRARYLRLWSCALLKVMHALNNLEYNGKLKDLETARTQIFGRIKSLLVENKDGLFIKAKESYLSLNEVEWKEAKTRFSILLKILHKPENIVDEVFDYLGVRFIVERSNDIPILLKALIEQDIIIPHQVLALRTRNSLLNIKNSKKTLGFLMNLLSTNSVSLDEFLGMCENLSWTFEGGEEPIKRANIFSSEHYKSVQFTVRHLVRTPNPAYLVLESMNNQLRRQTGLDRQEPWLESIIPEHFARYFPIEIQLMDLESYKMAKFGPASHEAYKQQQLKVVRDKIIGSLLSSLAKQQVWRES